MTVQTPPGLLSFPHVFVPRPPAPGAEPRYSLCLLFDKIAQATPQFLALRKAVAAAIDDKWGPGKSRDTTFVAKLRSPFRRTEDKEYAGYKDMIGGLYISPWSNTKPGIVDANRQDITVPGDVWPGQLARASVSAFGYQTSGNMGVSFSLDNLQICRTDLPRLDGRKTAVEEFDTWVGEGGVLAMADDDEPPFLLPWRRAA